MTATKTRKPKSPPVPSRSLEESYSDVSKLYQQFSHASFSRSEVASALKVSAESGPFAQRLFTIKEFGLLEAAGPTYQVSQLAKDLMASKRGTAEFKRMALKAIKSSDVFRELLEDFVHKLPAVATVAQRLETRKHFNADRAKTAAGVLEASLQFAGVLDGSGNILPVRDEPRTPGRGEPAPEEDQPDHDGENGLQSQTLRLQIPLGGGRVVTVVIPDDLTGADAKKVSKVLDAVSTGGGNEGS